MTIELVRPPALHPEHITEYRQAMESNISDKAASIIPHLAKITPHRILTIGAGTGGLEFEIANNDPDCSVLALDYSLPMIEGIEAKKPNYPKSTADRLYCIAANASTIPLQDNRVSSVIASSVLHEVSTFSDKYTLGGSTDNFLLEAFRVLVPNGRLIIRDFMMPFQPETHIRLEIGNKCDQDPMDPYEFIRRFVNEFRGSDLTYLKTQLDHSSRSEQLQIKIKDAAEVAGHFSWSRRFDDEVKEKYCYLPITDYAEHIITLLKQHRYPATLVNLNVFIQKGYTDHVNGRLNFYTTDGQPLPEPPLYTGVIVVEKSRK